MIKQFVSLDEAAAMLETDSEGIRQGYETNTISELPCYVYSNNKPFFAKFSSAEVIINPESKYHKIQLANGKTIGLYPIDRADICIMDAGDKFGEIDYSDLTQQTTGYPSTFSLKGYFRIKPDCLKRIAQTGSVHKSEVTPISWWDNDSIVSLNKHGVPMDFLHLLPSIDNAYADPPEFSEILFRPNEINEFKSGIKKITSELAVKEKQFTTRERNTFLRVIRALLETSKYKPKGAAASILRQLELLKLNNPKEDTIKKIIDEAWEIESDKS